MKRLGNGRFRFLRSQAGFTLIETILAVAILGFIGTGVVMAIDTNSRSTRVLDEQVEAGNLVTAYLEAIKQLAYDKTVDSEYSGAGANVTIPAQYSVAIVIGYSDNGTTWVDSAARTTEKLQRVTISVLRTDGKPVLSICTYRAER
ncbi:MAG: type II secretion system protein [Chloroflexi bacterium]|nr:type II secretion system protein [Chloroflexota bacterium]